MGVSLYAKRLTFLRTCPISPVLTPLAAGRLFPGGARGTGMVACIPESDSMGVLSPDNLTVSGVFCGPASLQPIQPILTYSARLQQQKVRHFLPSLVEGTIGLRR